jgi:hypothetical protein
MQERTRKQIGNGRERNMRMGSDVNAFTGLKSSRPEVVEKDERSDHLPRCGRQHAAYHKAAEIALARVDQLYDCHEVTRNFQDLVTLALELRGPLANHDRILPIKDVQTS